MELTPNLNLKKPAGTDIVNINDFNDNADALDSAIANKVDKISGKQLSTEDYTSAEKTKLSGIAAGANNYSHPTSDGNKHVPANGTTNTNKVLKASATAGTYSWGSVAGSEVTEDSTHRFATDAEKAAWNAKAEAAEATTSTAGLMSSSDKTKLNGIATGSNNYTHPSGDGNLHVPATSTTNSGKVLKAGSTAGSLSWGTLAKADVGLGSVDNTQQATKTEFNTHLADYVRQPGYGATAGSANTYTLTLSPAPTAYVDGMGVVVKVNAANTGAATINVNGLGAKGIVDGKGSALTSGKLRLNGIYSLKYSTTSGNFQLVGEGGEYGTAGAAQVLSGYTIGTDNGLVAGTIPSKGAQTYTPGATAQTIAAGQYLSGAQTVAAVSFDASKVLTGTTIAGTAGTMVNVPSGTAMGSAASDAATASPITLYASNEFVGAFDFPLSGYYNGSYRLHIPNFLASRIAAGATIGRMSLSGAYVTGTFSSDATATTGQILSGQTAYVNGNKVTGTMINRTGEYPADNISMWNDGTYNKIFVKPPQGYYAGGTGAWNGSHNTYITDNNFMAANIKKGTTIFGVTGTYDASEEIISYNFPVVLYRNAGTYTYTQSTNSKTLRINASGNNNEVILLYPTPISLSGKSRIRYIYSATNLRSEWDPYYSHAELCVMLLSSASPSFTGGGSGEVTGRVAIAGTTTNGTNLTAELDTTSYNGSYYIAFGSECQGNTPGGYTEITISSIKLLA